MNNGFTEYTPIEECENLEESLGEICLGTSCNKCGRFNKKEAKNMSVEDLKDSIKKAKLKEATQPWQKYLMEKTLIVGWLCEQYTLLGIKDEKDWIKNLCQYIYDNDRKTYNEIGYKSLDIWIEECELGNDGFGFSEDEIEIVEE